MWTKKKNKTKHEGDANKEITHAEKLNKEAHKGALIYPLAHSLHQTQKVSPRDLFSVWNCPVKQLWVTSVITV